MSRTPRPLWDFLIRARIPLPVRIPSPGGLQPPFIPLSQFHDNAFLEPWSRSRTFDISETHASGFHTSGRILLNSCSRRSRAAAAFFIATAHQSSRRCHLPCAVEPSPSYLEYLPGALFRTLPRNTRPLYPGSRCPQSPDRTSSALRVVGKSKITAYPLV